MKDLDVPIESALLVVEDIVDTGSPFYLLANFTPWSCDWKLQHFSIARASGKGVKIDYPDSHSGCVRVRV